MALAGGSAVNLRRGTYADANERSRRRKADPVSFALADEALLPWLQQEYSLEAPNRLTNRALADDGSPSMNGEAARWLGFHQDGPQNWTAIACAKDADGNYLTPLRCAIAKTRDQNERRFLGALACNVLYPADVARQWGIPDWCRSDVIVASIRRLNDRYRHAPLPTQSRPSESQSIAEAAAG